MVWMIPIKLLQFLGHLGVFNNSRFRIYWFSVYESVISFHLSVSVLLARLCKFGAYGFFCWLCYSLSGLRLILGYP